MESAHERGAALVAMIDGLERYRNEDAKRALDGWADDNGHDLTRVIRALKLSLVDEAIIVAEKGGLEMGD